MLLVAEHTPGSGQAGQANIWLLNIASFGQELSSISSRLDVLDMLFLGWLLAAFVIVAGVNLYLRYFGYPRRKPLPSQGFSTPQGGEPTQWINVALSWLHANSRDQPHLLAAWIYAINEELDRQVDDYNIKVESVQYSSSVPKLHSIQVEGGGSENLTLSAAINAQNVTLDVTAVPLASPTHSLSAEALIDRLAGQLKIVCAKNVRGDIQMNTCFFSEPEMELKLQPKKIDGSFNVAAIQKQVKQAISNALTTYNLTGRNDRIIKLLDQSPDNRDRISPMKATLHEFDIAKKMGSTGMGYSKGKRLMVKVIKANGLGDKDFGCSGPYCVVRVDQPEQQKQTSVVQNTVNPFWDENFVLDVSDKTRQIELELFDQDHRRVSPEFLGRASVPLAEIMRVPTSSSRQIVPLTGKPGPNATSGSVTVEFTFVDSTGQGYVKPEPGGLSSLPRKTVDTSHSAVPGGGVITTTTTTTERPYHGVNAARNTTVLVERLEGVTDMDEPSAFTPTGPHLGAHEMGIGQSSNLTRPSLMVTSPSEGDNSQPSQQQQQQQQHHNYYDYPTTSSANQSSSTTMDSKELMDKKKPGFAAAFKRKFQRKPKSRSMSADRTGSLKEGAHLQPPIQHGRQPEVPENGLRQKRSRSFSSSIRRLFRGKKKEGAEGAAATGRSRESSLSRHSTRSAQGAFDASPAYNGPREDEGSPDINDYPYSSSVPAKPSPMYGQFYTGHS